MKIVMISNLSMGGICTHTLHLAEALSKLGHKIHVISYHDRESGSVKFYKLPSVNVAGFYGIPFNVKNCSDLIKKIKPDILHFHHSGTFLDFFPKRLHRMTKRPFVVTLHSVPYASTTFVDRLTDMYFRLVYSQIKPAGKLICVSEFIKKQITENSPVPSNKLVVIPNGVDTKVFRPFKKSKSNFLRLLFVGRLSPEKGVDNLLDSFKIVSKRIKARLTIVGYGLPFVERYYELKLRRYKNINFVGSISDTKKLAKYYSDADILVFPSVWQEAFGMVIIESMACGTPPVAHAVGGVPEIIKHNHDGFLVKKINKKSLANAIIRASKADLSKIGKNARKTAVNRYSWSRIAKQTAKVYETALR